MSFATKPAAAAVDMTPSNRRFLVMALLFVTVVINYLDRSNLSIAAPSITSEFGLNPVQSGVVISAFGWTYTPLQIPGGWLVDRIHGCSTRSPSSSGRSQRSVSGSPPASSC
jgi:ACS family D-galactonate transporter-like MFS transporter